MGARIYRSVRGTVVSAIELRDAAALHGAGPGPPGNAQPGDGREGDQGAIRRSVRAAGAGEFRGAVKGEAGSADDASGNRGLPRHSGCGRCGGGEEAATDSEA